MNRDEAKKVSIQVGRPRTCLVLFDQSGHKVLDQAVIRHRVVCGSIITIADVPWVVVGWGPLDDTDCRAICRLSNDTSASKVTSP